MSTFSTGYTYFGTGDGRYTLKLLGNPNASPVVAPLPFVLYASGNGRGFLLDQSSASVITGTMAPQGKGSGTYSASQLPAHSPQRLPAAPLREFPRSQRPAVYVDEPTQGMNGTQYVGTG